MADSIFIREDSCFVPTEHAIGPWDRGALHGGAPAALIAGEIERLQPGAELPVARLTYDFLRPVPRAQLTLELQMTRPGRRVQGVDATMRAGEVTVCRASAVRMRPVPDGLPLPPAPAPPMPSPREGRPVRFALDGLDHSSFAATAMEMRFVYGGLEPGPARVWMRMRVPLLPGEPLTPLMRVAATADFGNGVSAVLNWKEHLFINADLSLQLQRSAEGEWIGLDARTLLNPGGPGLAESVLHDERGAIGRAAQSLLVQPR